jgi:hypothetical protein
MNNIDMAGAGAIHRGVTSGIGENASTGRRLCAHCQQRECRTSRNVFCSKRCKGLATKQTRPPCVICGQPVQTRDRKTCSRSCGWRVRRDGGGVRQMNAARADWYRRFLVERYRGTLTALAKATKDSERAKVLHALFLKGQTAGVAKQQNREARRMEQSLVVNVEALAWSGSGSLNQ